MVSYNNQNSDQSVPNTELYNKIRKGSLDKTEAEAYLTALRAYLEVNKHKAFNDSDYREAFNQSITLELILDNIQPVDSDRFSTDEPDDTVITSKPSKRNRSRQNYSPNSGKLCKLASQFQEVEAILGQRLRFNSLKMQIELDGQSINPDRIQLHLANHFNIQVSRANALYIITELAEYRTYSPIVEYLDRVYDQYGCRGTAILDNLAAKYFGTDNPIYNVYLRKSLIAAVGRAIKPGSKFDNALILQGKQGVGKSSFFRILASESWFDDSLGAISDKDERLKLHTTWFVEWAELESVFKRRDVASIKAFLSCPCDNIRPPYGRSIQEFKRPSIIVGSTNQDEFLADSTGNRRYWIIPVQQKIDLRQLQQERDYIWVAAAAAYKAGELWWLPDAEEQQSAELVSEYQISDPWQEVIADFVEFKTEVTTTDILQDCIHLDLEKQDRTHKMRVASILQYLGW